MQEYSTITHPEPPKKQPPDGGKNGIHKFLYEGLTAFIVIACAMLLFFVMFRTEQIKSIFGAVFASLKPILWGIAIAYILNPVMSFFDRNLLRFLYPRIQNKKKARSLSRTAAIIASLIFACIVIYILGSMILPGIVDSITGIVGNMQYYVNRLLQWVTDLTDQNEPYGAYLKEAVSKMSKYFEQWVQVDLVEKVNTYVGYLATGVIGVVSSLLNFIVGLIVSVYIMASKEKFASQGKMIVYAIFKSETANIIVDTVRESHKIFGGFITGKIIDSTIIGILCFIGLSLLNMPYVLLISVIIGVTNVVPFFGPYIGAIPSALLILFVSPIHCLYFLIFILALQQVDGNIIGPNILSGSTGLSPFWVVFAILVGGGLFGFPGMLLGVPTFAVIYYIIEQCIQSLLRRKHLKTASEDYSSILSIHEEDGKTIYTPLINTEKELEIKYQMKPRKRRGKKKL